MVLTMLARRLSVHVSKLGEVYYLGDLREEDRAILVRRVRRLSQVELERAINTLVGNTGSAETYEDGLLIVADRVEVIRRVEELLVGIESAESVTWVVQLFMVSYTDEGLKEIGLDVTPAGEVGLTFAAGSASLLSPSLPGGEAKLKASLNAAMKATNKRDQVRIISEPLLLLVDGSESTLQLGRRIPIQQSAVSGLGTVSTTGFQFVNTGLQISCSVREMSDRVGRMKLSTEISDVESFTASGAPLTSVESVDVTADVVSGGVYLLASLKRSQESNNRNAFIKLGQKKGHQERVMLIWGRTYRVGFDPRGTGGDVVGNERQRGSPTESQPLPDVWESILPPSVPPSEPPDLDEPEIPNEG